MQANAADVRNFLLRWYNSAEKCKTSGSLARATKSQRNKSTAFARTTSLYVGRQITFSPGADVMAVALTERIHLVSTA
jgi:hypothetical protein